MTNIIAQRRLVIGGLFLLSVLLYVDRVCISVAKGSVGSDLGISNEQMGWVFGMFTLGYALAQMPSGMLVDRFGPRLVLTVIVGIWSLFTALTGVVGGLLSLLVVRFLFGMGEAGAFPGAARVFYNWLPTGQRGLANGLMFSGSRLGGAIAFLVLPMMIGAFGWRASFFILGAIGCVWAMAWLRWFRDQPAGTAETPSAQISAPPAGDTVPGDLFRKPTIWLTMAQYFASNFTFFICLSWMMPYLHDRFQLTAIEAGRYAMIPLAFATLSLWTSGWLVDRLYASSRWVGWSRRLPAAGGFLMAGCGLALVTQMESPTAVVACFTLAVFGADMTISPSWTHCVDVAGKNSGVVSGSMNMVGNVGSFLSSIAFPYLLAWTGTATSYFVLAALLNCIAMLCWISIAPVKKRAEIAATSGATGDQ
jgi:MFS transporter, ACS family, glucarate transporter